MAYCVAHSLVRYSATTLAPEGWYPLQIPLERMILRRGWADLNSASVPATFAGLLVSGMVCGGILFAIGESLREQLRRDEADEPTSERRSYPRKPHQRVDQLTYQQDHDYHDSWANHEELAEPFARSGCVENATGDDDNERDVIDDDGFPN